MYVCSLQKAITKQNIPVNNQRAEHSSETFPSKKGGSISLYSMWSLRSCLSSERGRHNPRIHKVYLDTADLVCLLKNTHNTAQRQNLLLSLPSQPGTEAESDVPYQFGGS